MQRREIEIDQLQRHESTYHFGGTEKNLDQKELIGRFEGGEIENDENRNVRCKLNKLGHYIS